MSKIKLNLRLMGFCGVDDSVDPRFLSILSFHFPFVEWGVLFRPDLEGQPRYATSGWIENLTKVKTLASHDIHLAGHFCGRRCEEILEGDFSFIQQVYDWGFRRIQINATRANNVTIDMNNKNQAISNLHQCMLLHPSIEWIIQTNQETMFIADGLISNNPPSNISLLFDSSCGLGKPISEETMLMHSFPESIPCGYAGGIGTTNISSILQLLNDKIATSSAEGIEKSAKNSIWIDMESSLREIVRSTVSPTSSLNTVYEFKDVFSVSKCFECIQACIALLNMPV